MRLLLPSILFVLPMLAHTQVRPGWPHPDYNIVRCPGIVDGFYSHPTRCDLYIQCDNLQSQPSIRVLACQPGLFWNPYPQHCDWPQNTYCNSANPTTTTPAPTTTTTYYQHVRCPGNTDGLYPHPIRCHQYIQCVNMQYPRWAAVYLKTCPQGLLYNRHIQACDWPQNVNCNPYDTISTTSTPAPTTTTDGETGWVDVPCPGPKPGRYPDPDCRFYLHCTHTGTPQARVQRLACVAGLYFNPVTDLCDYPANVPSCGDESSTSSTTRIYPTKPTPHDQTRTHATRPTRTYPTRPTRTYPTRPTRTYPTRPTRTYPTRPTRTYPTRPTRTYPTRPTRTYPTRPTRTYPTRPTRTYPTRPTRTYPTRPTITYPTRPTITYPTRPTRTYPTIPTRETTTTEQTTTTEEGTTTPHPTRTNPTKPTRETRTTETTTVATGGNGQTGVIVRPFEPHFACVLDDGIILHPDPRNCSVYWSCVSLTTTQILRAIRHVCPRGQWFDRDLQRCNDIREVRNCALEAIHVPLIPNTDHAIPSEAPADAAPSYRG